MVLECDVDAAWALVEDYANDHHWRSGLVEHRSSTPLPVMGTEVVQTMRVGRTLSRLETTVVEVGERWYRFIGSGHSGPISGERRVEAAGTHSRFTFTVRLDLRGWYAVVAPAVRWSVDRQMRADLGRLAAVAPDLVGNGRMSAGPELQAGVPVVAALAPVVAAL